MRIIILRVKIFASDHALNYVPKKNCKTTLILVSHYMILHEICPHSYPPSCPCDKDSHYILEKTLL